MTCCLTSAGRLTLSVPPPPPFPLSVPPPPPLQLCGAELFTFPPDAPPSCHVDTTHANSKALPPWPPPPPLSRLYQEVQREDIVEAAHMEIAEPSIAQAIGGWTRTAVSNLLTFYICRGPGLILL